MSDEPDNLVLRYLRRISEQQERDSGKLDEVVRRLGKLELTVAGVGVDVTELSVRMDKFERRLDLVEEPHP